MPQISGNPHHGLFFNRFIFYVLVRHCTSSCPSFLQIPSLSSLFRLQSEFAEGHLYVSSRFMLRAFFNPTRGSINSRTSISHPRLRSCRPVIQEALIQSSMTPGRCQPSPQKKDCVDVHQDMYHLQVVIYYPCTCSKRT